MNYDPSNLNQLDDFRNKASNDNLSELFDASAQAFFMSLPTCGLRLYDLEYLDVEGRPRNGCQYHFHRASARVFEYNMTGIPRGGHSMKWREVSGERDWATIISTGKWV
jgi:hypothetical protein